MKKWNRTISKRLLFFAISGILSVFLAFLLTSLSTNMVNKLEDQQMAGRWSKDGGYSQVSCFFSPSAQMSEDNFMQFEYYLDKALIEASIVNESTNPSARLWADAYSANGQITIASDKASVSVNAIGVGGDFFLFHPLKLQYGGYFTGRDLMSDHIVIDEQIAWQLFGSSDIAGKIVYIGNVPHIINGVYKRDESRMAKLAGLDSSLAFVSYDTLCMYGNNFGLNTYEVVMPNPVKGYAYQFVSENIGVSENDVEVVENTKRYDFLHLYKILMQFGQRSMNSKAIIYPYWENIARGYEDFATIYFVFIALFTIYPSLLLLFGFFYYMKHKKWTVRSIFTYLIDKKDEVVYKWYRKKKSKDERDAEKMRKAELEILDLEEENNEENDKESD